MTAFALGPRDKAIIMAMFLLEALRWDQWQSQNQSRYRTFRGWADGEDAASFAAGSNQFNAQLASLVSQLVESELLRLRVESDSETQLSQAAMLASKERAEVLRRLAQLAGRFSDSGSELTNQLGSIIGDFENLLAASVRSEQFAMTEMEPGEGVPQVAMENTVSDVATYELDSQQFSELLSKSSQTREMAWQSAENLLPRSDIGSWPMQKQAPLSVSSTLPSRDSPFLRDAIRQEAEANRSQEQRNRFFLSK